MLSKEPHKLRGFDVHAAHWRVKHQISVWNKENTTDSRTISDSNRLNGKMLGVGFIGRAGKARVQWETVAQSAAVFGAPASLKTTRGAKELPGRP